MANLEYSATLGRLIRLNEPPGRLGRSTLLEAYDAIDAGEVDQAKRLLESFRYEQQIIQERRSSRGTMKCTHEVGEVGEPDVERNIGDGASAVA